MMANLSVPVLTIFVAIGHFFNSVFACSKHYISTSYTVLAVSPIATLRYWVTTFYTWGMLWSFHKLVARSGVEPDLSQVYETCELPLLHSRIIRNLKGGRQLPIQACNAYNLVSINEQTRVSILYTKSFQDSL